MRQKDSARTPIGRLDVRKLSRTPSPPRAAVHTCKHVYVAHGTALFAPNSLWKRLKSKHADDGTHNESHGHTRDRR